MKKLDTLIRYECTTSIKYVGLFYAIQYAIVLIVFLFIYISIDQVGVNGLELNSFIYLGILGVLGFKEDFRMLIQNGFTRKYIFLANFSLFAFTAVIMSFIDALMGNVLHSISSSYFSIFGSLYGYGHSFFLNWVWLFLIYMLVSGLSYLVMLIINKLGKQLSVYVGITFILVCVLLVPALFKFIIPKEFADKLIEFLIRIIGFTAGNTINFIYPILALLLIVGISNICSYCLMKRTELRI